ncbi:Diaminopimelate epimerase-like protein [Dentipellis sp. KUC8613]|nr:Diaminopimelate epimerase-like protein [Dentipellis sp. KUC8613]
MHTSTSAPFILGNAFTTDFGGGGPAAVVYVPTLATYSDATLLDIAKNFNQPMTAFVAKAPTPTPAPEADTAVFNIRWFTSEREVPLCGHATLVTSGAIFADPALVAPSVTALRFDAPSGSTLVARKTEDGRIEISLAAASFTDVREEDAVRLRATLARVFGEGLKVTAMKWGQGTEGMKHYVLVEVDTPDLGALKPVMSGFVSARETCLSRTYTCSMVQCVQVGSPFVVHVITSPSPSADFAFQSRMFAVFGDWVLEDPVCGSAHTLLAPYWKQKNSLPETFKAKQVSPRGGDLKVTVDEASGQIRLAGHVKLIGKGEIFP